MLIETNYAPSCMLCPKCQRLMRPVAIEPSMSVLDADDFTYRCGTCNHEEHRIRKADKA